MGAPASTQLTRSQLDLGDRDQMARDNYPGVEDNTVLESQLSFVTIGALAGETWLGTRC